LTLQTTLTPTTGSSPHHFIHPHDELHELATLPPLKFTAGEVTTKLTLSEASLPHPKHYGARGSPFLRFGDRHTTPLLLTTRRHAKTPQHIPCFFEQNEFTVDRRPFAPTPTPPPSIAAAASPASLRAQQSFGQTTSLICFFYRNGSSGSYRSPPHLPSRNPIQAAVGLTFTGPQSHPGCHGPYVPRSISIQPNSNHQTVQYCKALSKFLEKCTTFQDSYFDKGVHLWFLCRRNVIFLCYIYKFRIQLLLVNIYINHFVYMV
jgi:hypothetical protein